MTRLPPLRLLTAAGTVLLAALLSGTPTSTFAQSISAGAPVRQAPPAAKAPVVRRSLNTSAARPASNAYFESRTGTRALQRGGTGPWRLQGSPAISGTEPPPPRRHSRVTRSRTDRPANAGSSTRNLTARSLTAPPPLRPIRRISTHRINPDHPWAPRDSSGVHFGPRHESMPAPLPRTAALRAPQAPYFNPHAPATLHRLPRRHRTAHYRAHAWYEVNGHWYRRQGYNYYVLAIPPAGFVTEFLPTGLARIELGDQVIFVGRHLSFRQRGQRYVALDNDEHARALRATRGQASASDEPLFFSQAADIYVDPVSGQTRRQFSRDLKSCMNKAERRTGHHWQDLESMDDERDREQRYSALFGANRECLEVAGYVVY